LIKLGEPATLAVKKYSHTSGGSYSWSGPDTLVPDASGTYAIFTPEASGEAIFTVNYTEGSSADACSSQDSLVINVLSDCSITVHGVPLDGTLTLRAEATPAGGEFAWSNVSQVIPSVGNVYAYYTGDTPGTETVTVNYTTADGHACDPVTHKIDTYTVDRLQGPYCANSGDLISKDRYTIATAPIGYEYFVSISPEELLLPATSTSKTEEITITGSVNPDSYSDDATTTIVVANPSIKDGVSYSFSIPNYVNDALRALGVGDQTTLKLEQSFSQVKNCCNGTNISDSTEGNLSVILAAPPLEIPIAGIPLPKAINKYVTLDLLKLSISAGSDITITARIQLANATGGSIPNIT
jgi:hypothetical protein